MAYLYESTPSKTALTIDAALQYGFQLGAIPREEAFALAEEVIEALERGIAGEPAGALRTEVRDVLRFTMDGLPLKRALRIARAALENHEVTVKLP